MSPRPVQMPMSGRDRRYVKRELDAAEHTYKTRMKDAERAKADADAQMLVYSRAFCDAWNAAIFCGAPITPSPTIRDALSSGYDLIEVQCGGCSHFERIKITSIRRRPETQLVAIERKFRCQNCLKSVNYRSRAYIVRLIESGVNV